MKSKSILAYVVIMSLSVILAGCSFIDVKPVGYDEIDAVIRAFVDAVDNEDQGALSDTLAGTVDLDLAIYNSQFLGLEKSEFVYRIFDWVGDSVEAGLTANPNIHIYGNSAGVTAKMHINYSVTSLKALRREFERVDVGTYIEDSYDVEFNLTKVGDEWLISAFKVVGGDRHDKILSLIQALCDGMEDEDVDTVLAALTYPFELTCVTSVSYSKDELSTYLEQFFTSTDETEFYIEIIGCAELTDDNAIFLGLTDPDGDGNMDVFVFIDVVNDGGWLIESMKFV